MTFCIFNNAQAVFNQPLKHKRKLTYENKWQHGISHTVFITTFYFAVQHCHHTFMLKLSEEPIMQAHIYASLMLSATSNASNEEEPGNMTESVLCEDLRARV